MPQLEFDPGSILPQLQYVSVLYNTAKATILNKLQIAQTRPLTLALYLSKLSHTKDVRKLAKTETLHNIYLALLGK